MAKPGDAELDRLFQLPLGEFTTARNAMAKRAGTDGESIRALPKPPVAAWAVNQLYYKDRGTYEALVDAASELRKAHKAVLEGRQGDLRTAGREHDHAIEAALKATLALMADAGQPVTDATRQAILNTLRALPSDDDAPGRLTRTLAPGGFEMLAGISPRPAATTGKRAPAPRAAAAKSPKSASARTGNQAERAAAKDRERRAAAERAVREADQRARQAEFEAARAARDVSRADNRIEQARRALEQAQAELDAAERDAATAARAKETADKRSRQARETLEKLRKAL